jgi:hypothetical protein
MTPPITQAPGKVKGMSPASIKAIDAIKPYQYGDDALWQLHKLNNLDKHRALLTVGSGYHSLNIGAYGFRRLQKAFPKQTIPILDAFFKPANRQFPLKAGDVLFTDLPDAAGLAIPIRKLLSTT